MIPSVLPVLWSSYHPFYNCFLIQVLEIPWVLAVIIVLCLVCLPNTDYFSGTFHAVSIYTLSIHEPESGQASGSWLRFANIILNNEIIIFTA